MMEDNESIPDAAIRECLEEAGYLIKPTELVALGSGPKTNDVIVVLEGKIIEKRKLILTLGKLLKLVSLHWMIYRRQ